MRRLTWENQRSSVAWIRARASTPRRCTLDVCSCQGYPAAGPEMVAVMLPALLVRKLSRRTDRVEDVGDLRDICRKVDEALVAAALRGQPEAALRHEHCGGQECHDEWDVGADCEHGNGPHLAQRRAAHAVADRGQPEQEVDRG